MIIALAFVPVEHLDTAIAALNDVVPRSLDGVFGWLVFLVFF